MREMTNAPDAVVNVWPYVDSLRPTEEGVTELRDVACVYRDGLSRFDHVMIETERVNVFLVVIVHLGGRVVLGHHLLDLNIEYGLSTEH